MEFEVLECCGHKVSTLNHTSKFIDCFKSRKFFKKKLSDGREVKKEIVLLALCPNCKHYILKFLWYAKKGTRFHDWNDTKEIKGTKADEIFNRYCDFYDFYDIPDSSKNEPKIKHSRKIPWVYYKTVSDTEQIPRYIDESDNAGRKVYNPILAKTL